MFVDVWWFPGTNDPTQPCYGYWSAKNRSKRPVQFFGLTGVGPTILDYYTFSKDTPRKLSSTYNFAYTYCYLDMTDLLCTMCLYFCCLNSHDDFP